jgi:hypothetical protein
MVGHGPRIAHRAIALVAAALAGVSFAAPAASAATHVSSPTVVMNTPTTAAGGMTSYVVQFKTSASGALSQTGTVHVVFPTGTGLTALVNSPFSDGTKQVGFCVHDVGTAGKCYVYSGMSIAANHTAIATFNGVTNTPTAGTYHVTVSTSADTAAVNTPNFTVTAKSSLQSASVVMNAPTTSSGGATTYVVNLKTSATGALNGDSGSGVIVQFPAGTKFTAMVNSPLSDGTKQIGFCVYKTGTMVSCYVYTGFTLAANHIAIATMNGVANTAAGSYHLTVSSTSDTGTVNTGNYTVTASTRVSNVSISLSNNLPSASNVTYTIGLKVATALVGNTGSAVNFVLGAGTNLTGMTNSPLMDGATQVGFCANPSGTMVKCPVYTGFSVPAGHSLVAHLNGLVNPSTGKAYPLQTSTSSDVTVVGGAYCVVAAHQPCITSIAPTSGKVGAAVTITGINFTGVTAVKFHGTTAAIGTHTATSIATTVPTGATTGTITVTTPSGTATSTQTFTVLPSS